MTFRQTHPMRTNRIHFAARQRRGGFTLIELLLVLVILGILAAVVLPKFANRGEQARQAAAATQISNFSTALDAFEVDTGRYPHGTNVHFARISGPATLDVVHWERGAGATQACGTGAVATAAAAIARYGMSSPVELHVPGGVLSVEWTPGKRAVMTGDAVKEFETSA